MGSRIIVGLVFDNQHNDIQTKIKVLLNILMKNSAIFQNIKGSNDFDGDNWFEYNYLNNSIVKKLATSFNIEINFIFTSFIDRELNVSVNIKKMEDCFGFLICFKEDELLNTHCEFELNNITNKIITFVNCLETELSFDYAFCDNEAEILYSIKSFDEQGKRTYSLAFTKSHSNDVSQTIHRAAWHIDGLTSI